MSVSRLVEELVTTAVTSHRIYFSRRFTLPAAAALAYICRQVKCRHGVEWRPLRPLLVFHIDPVEFKEKIERFKEEKGEAALEELYRKAEEVMVKWKKVDAHHDKLGAAEIVLQPLPVFPTKVVEAEEA